MTDEQLAGGLVSLGLRSDQKHNKGNVQVLLADKTKSAYGPPPNEELIDKIKTLR